MLNITNAAVILVRNEATGQYEVDLNQGVQVVQGVRIQCTGNQVTNYNIVRIVQSLYKIVAVSVDCRSAAGFSLPFEKSRRPRSRPARAATPAQIPIP